MLKELTIKNVAVIEELCLDFTTGFHVLTGETGAGKSILVEAIGLVLGEKPQGGIVRDGADEAVVEAAFDVAGFSGLTAWLGEEGLDNSDDATELVVRRHVVAGGKGRIFVNGKRATLSILQRLAAILIDYTGQHQQFDLLDSRRDTAVLDGFLPEASVGDAYRAAYTETKSRYDAMVAFRDSLRDREERLDWIAHQLKEWEGLDIDSDAAEAALKERRERLRHAEAFARFGNLAGQVLTDGDASCVAGINQLIRDIEKSSALTGAFEVVLKNLRDTKVCLEDLSYDISKTAAHAVEGGISLDAIESQLFKIEKLKRKHGTTVAAVLAKREELESDRDRLLHADKVLDGLTRDFSQAFIKLKACARDLSAARGKTSAILEKLILKELAALKMGGTRFVVDVKPAGEADDFASYRHDGADAVSFLLSPNPGLALRPLSQIASGGETSRILLALKQVLTRSRVAGTFVFDEIDTGISGAAVELVGNKLKKLSERFQVLCITHHAQIASLADRHFLVTKEVVKGKTRTQVAVLSREERVREVARLMGGIEISEKNLAYAKEMVAGKRA